MAGALQRRRALTRIEKLVTARVAVGRRIDQQIQHAVLRARERGVAWPAIARAVAAGRGRARRRLRRGS